MEGYLKGQYAKVKKKSIYSKTCVKRPVKNRLNKGLIDNW